MTTDKENENQIILPILPLVDTVLFPGISLPIVIRGGQATKSVEQALVSPEKCLIVVAQRKSPETPAKVVKDDIYSIGTKAVIHRMVRVDGAINLVINGTERVRIDELIDRDSYFAAKAEGLPPPIDDGPEVEALQREILKALEGIKHGKSVDSGLQIYEIVNQVSNPIYQLYLIAVFIGLGLEKEQALLESTSRREACHLMLSYVTYESQVQELRDKISKQVASGLGKEQRDFVLRRQIDEIRKELGEEGTESNDIRTLQEQLDSLNLPKYVRDEAQKQMNRLSRLTESSPEYQVIRSYLELILDLPWLQQTQDQLDLERAEKILDDDHYDLKDVKHRILEQLAVLKLNPQAKAPILCFVGPPGVGKTSLGQSIARALGRQFERISLGGLHDEGELRGHRRTYIGAMPGRIIEAIRRAGYLNPLLMLDEIDKIGIDFRGDPAAALMEILDPAQNVAFHDNYLDIPFDLSHVFFIATANSLDRIPRALLDRMEILRLSGYSDEEKIQIAKRYIIPRQVKGAGLKLEQITISDEALSDIIRGYTREAGVRELERMISQVTRRVAMKVAKGWNENIIINQDSLIQFLGKRRVFLEQVRKNIAIGVATGLAWTEAGGDLIYIETSFLPNRKGEIKITGQLGKVMQESVQTAISYIWSQTEWLDNDDPRHRKSGIHVHIPAGAIPKDGPSAGVAIAVALTSLYSQFPVRTDIAMTGEMTLNGLVLPVGGIKEKVLAAHRTGIFDVIIPKANENDLEELPDGARKDMSFHLIDQVEDALWMAIPNLRKKEMKIRASRGQD